LLFKGRYGGEIEREFPNCYRAPFFRFFERERLTRWVWQHVRLFRAWVVSMK